MYDIWIRPLGKGKTTEYKNVKVAALDQDLQELMDEEKTEEPISLVKAQELMAIRWAEHQ
nr:hypothetical protein [Anaerolineae bacterium]NIQ81838.1 hypothetical protein [Anaerolineae bacterium]